MSQFPLSHLEYKCLSPRPPPRLGFTWGLVGVQRTNSEGMKGASTPPQASSTRFILLHRVSQTAWQSRKHGLPLWPLPVLALTPAGPRSVRRHLLAFPASLPDTGLRSRVGNRIIICSSFNYDFTKDRFFPHRRVFLIFPPSKKKK